MLEVVPPGVRITKHDGLLILKHPTYNFQCEKQSSLTSIPALFNHCPCDLLIAIAKQTLTGNCIILKSNG